MSPAGRALLAALRARRSERNIAGMRRFGIVTRHEQLGIDMTTLRALARPHRRDHALALELWDCGVMEAMTCATLIDDPRQITSVQMERWVRAADSWNLTDALAFLFDRTDLAEKKALTWSARRPEFIKRTGFALMAGMAVHRKELPDEIFLGFLPVIRREANDERNFVKKAVNWALRQIGKRNARLRRAAIAEARRILRLDTPAARWIARDALRELEA
jgi:3-methyladenine DNA glycosylase AlkD